MNRRGRRERREKRVGEFSGIGGGRLGVITGLLGFGMCKFSTLTLRLLRVIT
jgi:hypothetical protein